MESLFQQARALQLAGRLDEAEALYRQVRPWKPEWTLANLGVILRITGRLDEAESVLREALGADPRSAPIRHTLGMTLLQAGKYTEGWRFYEARHELNKRPTPPFREWAGESLKDKRIMVVAEQGLGDQILLSRFIPLLVQQAGEVVVAVPRVLQRLFGGLPAKVVYPQQDWSDQSADYWASIGSVPRWLEAGPADAPAPTLPCPAPARRPAGVGLMLGGAPGNGNNAHRLPSPAIAYAIRGLADFVDLDPAASGAADLAETAEIVAGLERVITVDTSVAHLAGALGKPCWVMMARPAIDWYTNWHDDRTPWYPSIRLIRQRKPGDWAGVIGGVAEALRAPI